MIYHNNVLAITHQTPATLFTNVYGHLRVKFPLTPVTWSASAGLNWEKEEKIHVNIHRLVQLLFWIWRCLSFLWLTLMYVGICSGYGAPKVTGWLSPGVGAKLISEHFLITQSIAKSNKKENRLTKNHFPDSID